MSPKGRKYDHGYVTMKDGNRIEFGFTSPTNQDLARCGGDFWKYAAEVALQWANVDRDHAYTEDDIQRLQLAR